MKLVCGILVFISLFAVYGNLYADSSGFSLVRCTLQASAVSVLRGDVLTYSIRITNSGNEEQELVLTNEPPVLTDYVADSLLFCEEPLETGGGFPLSRGYSVVVAPNETICISYQVTVARFDSEGHPLFDGQLVQNILHVADSTDTRAFSTVTRINAPVLEVEKSEVLEGSVLPGAILRLVTRVVNSGQAPAINIQVVDSVPEWTLFLGAEGPEGAVVEYADEGGEWQETYEEDREVVAVRWSNVVLSAFLPDGDSEEEPEKPYFELVLIVQVR